MKSEFRQTTFKRPSTRKVKFSSNSNVHILLKQQVSTYSTQTARYIFYSTSNVYNAFIANLLLLLCVSFCSSNLGHLPHLHWHLYLLFVAGTSAATSNEYLLHWRLSNATLKTTPPPPIPPPSQSQSHSKSELLSVCLSLSLTENK